MSDEQQKQHAWQRFHEIRNLADGSDLPATGNLPPFRGKPEMGILRKMRRLRGNAPMDFE